MGVKHKIQKEGFFKFYNKRALILQGVLANPMYK